MPKRKKPKPDPGEPTPEERKRAAELRRAAEPGFPEGWADHDHPAGDAPALPPKEAP